MIFYFESDTKYKAPTERGEDYCVMYTNGLWKLSWCHDDNSEKRFWWSQEKVKCPADVSNGWRYHQKVDSSVSLSCFDEPKCCKKLQWKSGPHTIAFVLDIENKLHNNNVKYKERDGSYCLQYDGYWRVTYCHYDRDIVWSEEKPKCPSDVGSQWRKKYRQDDLDEGISVICLE